LFLGGTVGEMVAQMAFPKPVPLRSIRPEISEALERTVMRALVADPAGRYNRCDDFARALNEIAVRENLSVSSEDVGNYVRAMCPEEFAAERHLQSKLSSERKKGSSPAVQPPAPQIAGTAIRPSSAGRATDQFPGTIMREPSPSSVPMTAAQRAMSGMVQGQSPPPQQRPPSSPIQAGALSGELVIQKSKGPMIAVILAVLVLGGGGVTAVLMTQKKDPAPVEPVALVEAPKQEDPRPELVVAKVDLTRKAEPAKEEPTKEEPDKEEPGAAKIERTEVKGEVLIVFRDKGELWVRAGKKVKLKAGDEVKIVGPAIQGSALREVYGSGALMEVNGSVGRVDEGVVVPKGAVAFAVIEKGAVAAAAKKKGAFAVAAANATPTAQPEAARTEPVKTEPAKAQEPPTSAQKLDDKKEDAPAVAVAAPKAEPLVLKGRLEMSGMRGVVLHNETTFRWHGCDVRMPGKKFFRFEASDAIEAGDNDNIRLGNFEEDRREPDQYMLQGYALVRCKEAQGYVWFGKQKL
jgi:hypothetical protein